jgi:hypothetical protein
MADIHEQRINTKFCFKLGKTFTEAHEMMQNVYSGHCTGCTHYEWFMRIKDSWQSTHDEPCLGLPSTSLDDAHVAQVREIVRSNRV